MYTVCVLGATGSVGSSIVKNLINSPNCTKIVIIHRRQVPDFVNLKVETHIIDITKFDDPAVLSEIRSKMSGCDSVFMTLGAGLPSKISAAELVRIDHSMPLALLSAAAAAGLKHASVMTAAGADSSRKELWFLPQNTGAAGAFYAATKGRVEDDAKDLAFPSVGLFRPAALLGAPNTPKYMNAISPLLVHLLPDKFWSIHIDELANAMVRQGEESLERGRRDHWASGKKSEVYEGKGLRQWSMHK